MANDGFFLALFDPAQTYRGQKRFDCGNPQINRFVVSGLKKQVRSSLSRGFVLLDGNQSDRFIGFYTLSSFTVDAPLLAELSAGRLPAKVPCARMVMLGIDIAYQQRGLGLQLLADAMRRTLLAAQHIGVLGLYLDAAPGAYGFYASYGFRALSPRNEQSPTPMFLHIETIRAGLG